MVRLTAFWWHGALRYHRLLLMVTRRIYAAARDLPGLSPTKPRTAGALQPAPDTSTRRRRRGLATAVADLNRSRYRQADEAFDDAAKTLGSRPLEDSAFNKKR